MGKSSECCWPAIQIGERQGISIQLKCWNVEIGASLCWNVVQQCCCPACLLLRDSYPCKGTDNLHMPHPCRTCLILNQETNSDFKWADLWHEIATQSPIAMLQSKKRTLCLFACCNVCIICITISALENYLLHLVPLLPRLLFLPLLVSWLPEPPVSGSPSQLDSVQLHPLLFFFAHSLLCATLSNSIRCHSTLCHPALSQ